MALEKGLDLHGNVATAEGDVTGFYDNIRRLLLLWQWLPDAEAPMELTASALNSQVYPSIVLSSWCTHLPTLPRTTGVLTDTRCANLLGRIPVQSNVKKYYHEISALGYARL